MAISTLLLVVTISLLITRVGTVILTATGMSRQAARFQARSAFSGAGFTTSESEAVVDHPVRRRVIAMLMLLGSAGTVAVISTLILGFGKGGGGRQWWRILELVVGLLALIWLSRSRWVDRRLTRAIGTILNRYTELPSRDVASLLDLAGDYAVSELAVTDGDWIAGRTLGDLALRDEGAVVLGVTTASGRYIAVPTADTRVNVDDVLIVYGRADLLCELDNRRVGPAGDAAHHAAVDVQRGLEQLEQDRAAIAE